MQHEDALSIKVKMPGWFWFLCFAFFLYLSNPKGDQALKMHIRMQEGAFTLIRNVETVNLVFFSIGSARIGLINADDRMYIGCCGTFFEIGG